MKKFLLIALMFVCVPNAYAWEDRMNCNNGWSYKLKENWLGKLRVYGTQNGKDWTNLFKKKRGEQSFKGRIEIGSEVIHINRYFLENRDDNHDYWLIRRESYYFMGSRLGIREWRTATKHSGKEVQRRLISNRSYRCN